MLKRTVSLSTYNISFGWEMIFIIIIIIIIILTYLEAWMEVNCVKI